MHPDLHAQPHAEPHTQPHTQPHAHGQANPQANPHAHLQQRGHRGGEILPHRSIWSLRLPRARLAGGALIAVAFTLLLAWAQPWVTLAWGGQIVWWMQVLELPGHFAVNENAAPNLFSPPVPMIDLQLRDMGPLGPLTHALAAVSLWIVAGWLPDHAKPAAFLLRFALLIHGASVLYFLLWPASFPHSLISHTGGGLRQIWALMLLTPWIHLCIYYLFPFAAWQRLAVTALTLGYLALLAPLLYATHVALLHLLGLIVMPVLHLLLGVMLPIIGFVALYGWAMSWHDPARAERAERGA